MSRRRTRSFSIALLATFAASGCVAPAAEPAADPATEIAESAKHLGVGDLLNQIIAALIPMGYNVHTNLYDAKTQNFEPIQAGADVERGRALFGIAADLQTEDTTEALFEGFSVAANAEIVSNGRSCFTCHRGADVNFGFAPPPMSASVPADDPLFTGLDADAQQDPDGLFNMENFALMKYRPGRFNQARSQDDPFRQVFFWRKSVSLVNVAFQHGFLNDGRGRAMFETDRGAIFSHTQEGDERFDDLIDPQDLDDLQAFQFSLVSDERLLALRDTSDPLHETLVNDPFYTVDIETPAQERGRQVFVRNCMSCHNAPNVFNNAASLETLGTDGIDPGFPVPAPHVGRNFNVGVSERNRHDLRFTLPLPGGSFEPIVLPLANENGTMNMHTVTFDIGLAATTGRTVDIGRFKVPQLRNVRNLAPYFHDNSAATLEEVVDYFNGPYYNNSVDGRRQRIRMNAQQRADLLEFLNVL
jgi:cytochrome c peroxidase